MVAALGPLIRTPHPDVGTLRLGGELTPLVLLPDLGQEVVDFDPSIRQHDAVGYLHFGYQGVCRAFVTGDRNPLFDFKLHIELVKIYL